jgi:hypothetical protein
MTKSSKIDYSNIDVHDVLNQRRQIALIWSVEDVQGIRSDLNDDQAWQVLQECARLHDCELGITWGSIEFIADDLFPQFDKQSDEKGGRS